MENFSITKRSGEVRKLKLGTIVASTLRMLERAEKLGSKSIFFPEAGALPLKYITEKKLKQKAAAEVLGISQPRVSDLLHGKIAGFSIDQLIKMHERIHINVALVIDDRLVA